MNVFRRAVQVGYAFACLLIIGCKQDEIKSYSVPREAPPSKAPMAMNGASPAGMPDQPATPGLKWKTPASWQEVPPGEMRVASFKIAGKDGAQADVSIIPLPGAAGGDFSNVNRWRGQVGLPPVSEMEVKKQAEPVVVSGESAVLYDQGGELTPGKPTRILAAIQHRGEMAWFFKMTGESQLVSQEKETFVEFLKSVQFPTGMAATELPSGHPAIPDSGLPAGHPDISGTPPSMPAAPVSSDGKPRWEVPAGWKEVAGGQFLAAKFIITGEGSAQAAVNVSTSAGNGGGLAANVNRWRKQLGLDELPADEITKSAKSITTTDGQALVVELNGQSSALVGAVVLQPGHAWFYKLMGDPKVVAAQKDAFLHFVQGVKY